MNIKTIIVRYKLFFLAIVSLVAFSGCIPKIQYEPVADPIPAPSLSGTIDEIVAVVKEGIDDVKEKLEEEGALEEESLEPPESMVISSTFVQYKGAWFDVLYPDNFIIHEREKAYDTASNFDGVAFASPDGAMEFYVYSPQWGGISKYETVLETEKVSSSKTVEQEQIFSESRLVLQHEKKIEWVTIDALNGEYARSYVVTTEENNTVRYLFGIKYATLEDLEAARIAYEAFKASLIQYAD